MTEVRVRLIKDGPFEINELAGLVPMATPKEQVALTEDINNNGQREPIVLWKGKVVDGRCRQLALTTLGNRDITYKELDDTLTEEEVTIYVKSVNTRRNLTVTQKAITGAKEWIDGKGTQHSIAKSWGISERLLASAKYIATHKPEFIKPLFDGRSVSVMVQRKYESVEVDTDKVSIIAKAVKYELERAKLVKDNAVVHEWNADSLIATEAGKQWYAEHASEIDPVMIPYMIELANFKFYTATEVAVLINCMGSHTTAGVSLTGKQVEEIQEQMSVYKDDEWSL